MEKENQELDFCLLIPCYNNKEGLLRSLSSVRYHKDLFLIVVVDDGSEEPVRVEDIEKELQIKLPLTILRLNINSGITRALNTGLEWIEKNQRARYIARLDCADICDPDRFYVQVDYMKANPETGLTGTWCLFEERGHKNGYKYTTPTKHKDIYREMYFRNVFIHPTVMFRRDLAGVVGGYPYKFELTEDYALFWKIIEVSQVSIINRFLVTCEINREGISHSNRRAQLLARQRIISSFGTNLLLRIIGILKLRLLLVIPKSLILRLKQFNG